MNMKTKIRHGAKSMQLPENEMAGAALKNKVPKNEVPKNKVLKNEMPEITAEKLAQTIFKAIPSPDELELKKRLNKEVVNWNEIDADPEKKPASPPAAKETILQTAEKSASLNEEQREEESKERDVREDWLDWLRGIAASAGIKENDARKVQADWVDRHFSMNDTLLSRRMRAQIESGWAIEGAPVELQMKIAAASGVALAESPARWKRFARTTLADTLRRMEERGDTPEEEIDVLIRALRPVRERLRPALADLLQAARARLSHQRLQNDGYYKTRNALGDMMADLKDEASLRRRCALYWEILDELRAMDPETIAAGVWASIVNADANNLAATLDDLHELPASVYWMKQAVVAGAAARMLGEDAAPQVDAHAGLQSFFSVGTPVTPEWAALLDDMGNVPGTWRHIDESRTPSDLVMWCVEIASAVARAGMTEEASAPRKVASALFNAGVTILRAAKTGRTGWTNIRECRIVFNGAGLLWVLNHGEGDTPDDFRKAMVTHRGGSCAVNLMGALADRAQTLDENVRGHLSRFAGALYGLKPAMSGADFVRIEQSMQKLKLQPTGVEENPLTALTALVGACLAEEGWQSAWQAFAQQPGATTLGILLKHSGSQVHPEFFQAVRRLAGSLSSFEQQADNWPMGFLEASITPPEWLTQAINEWRAFLDGPTLPARLKTLAGELIHD
jgi:hypothetical protein